MKFARDFKETLASQDFPSHWVDHAIPYGQLKKCLKKILLELQDLGLDQETLHSLIDQDGTSPVILNYNLNSMWAESVSSPMPSVPLPPRRPTRPPPLARLHISSHCYPASNDTSLVRPQLTVCVHLIDGMAVDASLAPASRRFLERLVTAPTIGRRLSTDRASPDSENNSDGSNSERSLPTPPSSPIGSGAEVIEVPLVFDNRFFEMLQSDVSNIDTLQAKEQKQMSVEITEIGKHVSRVSKPARFSSSDLTRWRDIFELYLDAEVFFSTNELNHGVRSGQQALRQLQWFESEVEKRQLTQKFKLPESHLVFARFRKLNLCLLKNLQFQELNKTAILKILKKFDKRTCFGISKRFRSTIQAQGLMTGDIGKDVCAQLSQELLPIVPQLNDYLCPVCYVVAYIPIRLECRHVFCIRCVVKMQRRGEKHCPMCRSKCVMKTSIDNIDSDMGRHMRRYFPQEVKKKEREDKIERGIEDYGPNYTHKECIVM